MCTFTYGNTRIYVIINLEDNIIKLWVILIIIHDETAILVIYIFTLISFENDIINRYTSFTLT